MKKSGIHLSRRGDVIYAEVAGEKPVEVKLVYARPVSDRSRMISVLTRKGKKELAWIETLDELDGDSREVAREALAARYQISRIEAVKHSFVNHGHRYLKVETNRGFRYFNLKEPGKNVTWLNDDFVVIRDSMGNRYEADLAKLDTESRERLERVL